MHELPTTYEETVQQCRNQGAELVMGFLEMAGNYVRGRDLPDGILLTASIILSSVILRYSGASAGTLLDLTCEVASDRVLMGVAQQRLLDVGFGLEPHESPEMANPEAN